MSKRPPWAHKTTPGSDHEFCTIYEDCLSGRAVARHVTPEHAEFIVRAATTNANNCSTATMPTMEEFRQIAAKFEAIRRESLRRSVKLVEQACGICGRKPIVTDEGGHAVVVCIHFWDALHRLPKAKPPVNHPTGLALHSPLNGVRIELYDDGPARW